MKAWNGGNINRKFALMGLKAVARLGSMVAAWGLVMVGDSAGLGVPGRPLVSTQGARNVERD